MVCHQQYWLVDKKASNRGVRTEGQDNGDHQRDMLKAKVSSHGVNAAPKKRLKEKERICMIRMHFPFMSYLLPSQAIFGKSVLTV